MPAVLKIDRGRRLVYSSFHGKVTGDELLRHRGTIAADPDFSPDFDEIVDFTAVNEIQVNKETIATMAESQSLYSPTVKHVVVAPAEVAFKLANEFKDLAGNARPNLTVVRTRADAYRLVNAARG